VSGTEVHRTGLHCTSLHRLQEVAVFYPVFYPKKQHSEVEMLYLLVKAANGSRRPEFISSLPSWSCGFDSRRPLREILVHRGFSIIRSTNLRDDARSGRNEGDANVHIYAPARMLTRGTADTTEFSDDWCAALSRFWSEACRVCTSGPSGAGSPVAGRSAQGRESCG
jgi:hypothetical protein